MPCQQNGADATNADEWVLEPTSYATATQCDGIQGSEDQKLNYGVETLQGLFAAWTTALAKQQPGYQEAPDPDPDPNQDTDGYGSKSF